MRALGEGGGLCLGRATATVRWRQRGDSGRRGTAREAPARGKEGGGRLRRDAWKLACRRWHWEAALHGGRAALCTAAVSKQVGRQEKGKMGCFAIFEISRDLNVKQG